jgi:hypothetical protein
MDALFVWLLGLGSLVLGLALFAALSLASEVGYRFGLLRRARVGAAGGDHTVTATLTAGMVALLAFILGLTINFAQNRFEVRRDLVVDEANAIGTAWLRAHLIGAPDGEAIAEGIHRYARLRLEFTRTPAAASAESLTLQTHRQAAEIWERAAVLARAAPTPITATLITALNTMFDDAQAQRFAFLGEAPGVMLEMMFLGAILAIGAMGYEAGLRGPRQLLLTSLLLAMWTGGMVMTVDLARPRLGAVRVDPQPLEWTLEEIEHAPPTPTPGAHP